jgi:plasmid stability protein
MAGRWTDLVDSAENSRSSSTRAADLTITFPALPTLPTLLAMATLNIRNLPDDVHHRLRMRAAEHGRSMEAEARVILTEACLSGRKSRDRGRGHSQGRTTASFRRRALWREET